MLSYFFSFPTFFCVVVLALLGGGGPGSSSILVGVVAQPTIVKYNNRTAWNLAVPGGAGPTWCVDFNYLTSDSRIGKAPGRTFLDTASVTRLGLAMEPVNASNTIQNDIDATPFAFSGPINATTSTYAALWVDRDSGTRVRLTFIQTDAVRAWSADFAAIGTVEALQANIVSRPNATANTTTSVQDVTSGFWGITINEDILSILFTAKNTNGNPNTGENFSMDNVCVRGNSTGTMNIPTPTPPTPPTPAPPTPTPPFICEIAIPIIGPLFCILYGFINGFVGGIVGGIF